MVLAETTTVAQPAAAEPLPSSVELHYFAGRGLAETSRMLLAAAGVTFKDVRYPISKVDGKIVKPEMEKAAATGSFASNLDRLPVLKVTFPGGSSGSIGGSGAVQRFIANTYGLMGSNSMEAGVVDMISEHVGDIKSAWRALKEEDKATWFTDEASAQGARRLPWYLTQLNKCLTGSSFAVGSKLSLADAVIFMLFAETATTAGLFGAADSQPFDSSASTATALAKFAPKVAASAAAFGSAVASYRASRGDLAF
jgi:glutathione S-transferase